MSLDISLTVNRPTEVFEYNITHNLTKMAMAAGLYSAIWRPEEVNFTTAKDLIEPLRDGLAMLEADPAKFRALEPENGWGDYLGFVKFVRLYLKACEDYPDADVSACR